MLAWDNSARNRFAPSIYHNFSIKLFKEWLTDISIFTREHLPLEEQVVFINAWNEWAEGTYLEPDRKYGYAALNTLKNVIFDLRNQEYLDETPVHNYEIYQKRWGYLKEELSLNELDDIEYEFMQDYVAAFKYFNRKAQNNIFTSQKGRPYWRTRGDLYREIFKRENLSEIYYEYNDKNAANQLFAFVILQYNNEKYTIECINSLKELIMALRRNL
jgi:hypothetical protein